MCVQVSLSGIEGDECLDFRQLSVSGIEGDGCLDFGGGCTGAETFVEEVLPGLPSNERLCLSSMLHPPQDS